MHQAFVRKLEAKYRTARTPDERAEVQFFLGCLEESMTAMQAEIRELLDGEQGN